ncbi:MAG: triose-phosphate isomerase [bacterium]|nr:triose-phosphate isomerase [bacterium]
MNKLSVRDLDVKGKRILIRTDFNVPLDKKGEIIDIIRITSSIPTIKNVIDRGGRAILISHLGRAKGEVIEGLRMNKVAEKLEVALGKKIKKLNDCIGTSVEMSVAGMKDGDVILLENVRFYNEEEDNDPEFAQKLAKLCDYYVNDAFSVSHRAHASVVGVTKFVSKAAAGLLMEKEIKYLGQAVQNPKRPFLVILGGSKVSDKIEIFKHLLHKVDTFLIGGGMAYTFLKSQGILTGDSLVEKDKLDVANEILENVKKNHSKIILPVDHIIADEFSKTANSRVQDEKSIPDGWRGMDIGPKTIELFKKEIEKANTILWNGPVGVYELPQFKNGTIALAKLLAESKATTIIGGGDSAAAIHDSNVEDKITHISTGGGASLEFLEGKSLPGIEALSDIEGRKIFIAGNWKMNTLQKDARILINGIKEKTDGFKNIDIAFIPPYTHLFLMQDILKDSNIKFGAQNMYFEEKGAYTGEISPLMLKDLGCTYVIIGHSERRKYFNENDELLNKKIKSALKHGLFPIYCVGETQEERDKNLHQKVVEKQLINGLTGITSDEIKKITIAYEPVWAIGTGKNATPEQAEEMHKFIRNRISVIYDEEISSNVRIQYGGSVTSENVADILKQENIDGALVGGASLKIDTFSDLLKIANNL